MLIPPFLKKGDIIGITATARKISKEELESAVNIIESNGYKVQFAVHLFAVENQFLQIDVYFNAILSRTFSGNGYLNAINDTINGAATFHSYNLC